ncbi:MAG: SulP family inorganic anion transporter [Myxococcota bacterium]
MIPLLRHIRTATAESLRADGVAGITTAIMLVPQAMAYAMLAGLEPIVGLYASTLPLMLYALFGSSRPLAVGPVAMDSLMVSAGLVPLVAEPGAYAETAAWLALLVGGIQIVLGLMRAGFLVQLLTKPVILGFTAAAALIIGSSQLGAAMGVSLPRSQQVHQTLWAAVQHADRLHWLTLGMTLASVVILLTLKRVNPRFPRFLLVVGLGTLTVWGFGLEASGIAIVGDVPAGLPTPQLPHLDPAMLVQLLPTAFAIAWVAMLEALSVAKAYQDDVDPNRELFSIGLANVGSGLVAGYPITGGFSRTAVNAEAGARSPLAGLVTSGLVVLTLLFLTDAFTFLPRAILASIIMTAVAGLIDLKSVRALYQSDRHGFALCVLTFVATLTLGIQLGIATGVAAGLLLKAARRTALLGLTAEPHLR